MRIVVFSDSHGNPGALRRVVEAQPEARLFLFLGDGLRDFEQVKEQYPQLDLRAVRGNCDFASGAKTYDIAFFGGKRILYTHGHTCHVKLGLEVLLQRARENQADVVLFGHTHVAYTSYEDGLYLLNPGSVSHPRDGRATYGIVDITDAGIVPGIVRL